MAIDLRRRGFVVSVEVPFNPTVRGGKDADIVLDLNGTKHWLDVVSVLPKAAVLDLEPMDLAFPLRSRSDLADAFAKRIAKKYVEKFSEAVASGPLAHSSGSECSCAS